MLLLTRRGGSLASSEYRAPHGLIVNVPPVTTAVELRSCTVSTAFQSPGNGKRNWPVQTPLVRVIGTGIPPTPRDGLLPSGSPAAARPGGPAGRGRGTLGRRPGGGA